MHRLRILCTLVAVVAVLAAALAFLRDVPVVQEIQPVQQEAAYRMLYTCSRQEFKAMTVTLATGERFTVLSDMGFDENGNLLGVYNSLGQPVIVQGQESFALDSISYQMMLLTAMNLPVTASYPGLDPEACGLASPAARIEIMYHTREPIVLTIGSITASGQSCYVQAEGDDSVHLVPADFHQIMTRPLKAHHRLPGAINNASSKAVQIAIVRPGEENFIAANYGTSERILPWQVNSPYTHAGSTERITAFIQAVAAIHADAYVTTVVTVEELVTYGLDDPTRLLVAYSDGTIRDIHLGNDAGDGTVYARMDSTADVYRISTTQLPDVEGNALDALLDRFIALIPTTDVTALAVRAGEEEWLLSIDASKEQDDYAINGAEVDADVFSEAYKAVVGMQFDKTTKAEAAGTALCQVRFSHGDGTVTGVDYYEYDHHYIQVETTGGASFLIRRERLEEMLNVLKEAVQ